MKHILHGGKGDKSMEKIKSNNPTNVIKGESKTKRVNLLIKPTTHKLAIEECAKLGISLNEAINQLLENWVDDCLLKRDKKD